MREYSNGAPKCLIPIGKETLLSREIRMLKEKGFSASDVLVVSGYKSEMLKDCGATLVYNAEYDKTDNSYSLALALRQAGNDDIVVMDSDLVFDSAVLDTILNDTRSNVVLSKASSDLQESTGRETGGRQRICLYQYI